MGADDVIGLPRAFAGLRRRGPFPIRFVESLLKRATIYRVVLACHDSSRLSSVPPEVPEVTEGQVRCRCWVRENCGIRSFPRASRRLEKASLISTLATRGARRTVADFVDG